jgi:hypothetical protein
VCVQSICPLVYSRQRFWKIVALTGKCWNFLFILAYSNSTWCWSKIQGYGVSTRIQWIIEKSSRLFCAIYIYIYIYIALYWNIAGVVQILARHYFLFISPLSDSPWCRFSRKSDNLSSSHEFSNFLYFCVEESRSCKQSYISCDRNENSLFLKVACYGTIFGLILCRNVSRRNSEEKRFSYFCLKKRWTERNSWTSGRILFIR